MRLILGSPISVLRLLTGSSTSPTGVDDEVNSEVTDGFIIILNIADEVSDEVDSL